MLTEKAKQRNTVINNFSMIRDRELREHTAFFYDTDLEQILKPGSKVLEIGSGEGIAIE